MASPQLCLFVFSINPKVIGCQLSDALNFNISICLKLKEGTNLVSFDNFMEKEFIIALELFFLDSNIKKEICGVLDPFFFLKRKYEKRFITCCL
jgi:hypothetical protein